MISRFIIGIILTDETLYKNGRGVLILLSIIVSLFVLFSVDLLSFALKRKGWSRFISSFLLFYALVIALEFVLGAFSVLNTATLLIGGILIPGLIIWLVRRKFTQDIFKKYWISLKRAIKGIRGNLRTDRLWLLLVIVAAALIAWISFLGILFPATDFDGNSYHLTFIGNVLQYQNFFDTATSLGWLSGYPKGGEFIQMWSVITAHNDTFVDLTQIPFLLLGVYALYEISKSLGANEKHARFSSLLFLFLPIVLNQLKTTYIDVMLCALFFAAIAMVVRRVKLGKLDLVLIGVIFSLLISVKYTGFLFVAATLPLLVWNLHSFRDKHKKKFTKNFVRPLLLAATPTVFGLYWYIKNVVLYGSPLYPFGLNIGGVTIFQGRTFQDLATEAISTLKDLPTGCVDRIWFVWTEQKDWFGCFYNYDANFTGLGPIWFIILIPAFIASIYLIIKHKNYLYGALSALILGVFAIYPINYYSRYTMFITILGIISLAIVMSYIKPAVSKVVKFVIIILAISVFATNFVLCNFPPGVVKDQIKNLYHGNTRGAAYASTLGQAYIFLQARVQANEVVAYDSSPYFIYPLWKPDYSNDVIYVPADTKTEWLGKLKDDHVKYVFTNMQSKERKWLTGDQTVTSVYKDAQYEIYQIY